MTDPNEIRDIVRQLAQEEVLSLIAQSTSPGDNRNGDQRGRQGVNAESVDIPLFETESEGGLPPKAFDLDLEYDSGSGNTTATCSNLYEISGLVQLYQAGTISVSLPDSDAYLGYEYTFATGIITLVTGTALSDVSESSQPAATATSFKRALYHLIQSGDSWYISVDLRNQPVNAIRM